MHILDCRLLLEALIVFTELLIDLCSRQMYVRWGGVSHGGSGSGVTGWGDVVRGWGSTIMRTFVGSGLRESTIFARPLSMDFWCERTVSSSMSAFFLSKPSFFCATLRACNLLGFNELETQNQNCV